LTDRLKAPAASPTAVPPPQLCTGPSSCWTVHASEHLSGCLRIARSPVQLGRERMAQIVHAGLW